MEDEQRTTSEPVIAAVPRIGQASSAMPRISYFYGITIRIYYDEHPPPHFHAIYGDEVGQIEIEIGKLIGGTLPRRALALVRKWRKLHVHELMEDWNLAQAHRRLKTIEPLE